MKVPRRKCIVLPYTLSSCIRSQGRSFSALHCKYAVRDIGELPDRIHPNYEESKSSDLLSLRWPSPPRNVLLVKKDNAVSATDSLIDFAKHIKSTYPSVSIVLEPHVAAALHDHFAFPIYSTAAHPTADDNNVAAETAPPAAGPPLHSKVDLAATLGGDGTILHASSLFASTPSVPPILSFSMGTLGFLGEWRYAEHKRAFREVYMSGAGAGDRSYLSSSSSANDDKAPAASSNLPQEHSSGITGWSSIRGRSMGLTRGARVLLRNRLKVGVFDARGDRVSGDDSAAGGRGDIHAMNEVIIHRGKAPHLAVIEVYVGGRFLTEAVADGMIISTPTGSTAYSLSSGGSIVHPLVSSLQLTPICPRSLSFRPLVLPANTPITLRLSEKNRARELEVSIDGRRRSRGIGVGMEVRAGGEDIRTRDGAWVGGVPCVLRGAVGGNADINGDDGWVGGLNSLLKFNYPFGDDG